MFQSTAYLEQQQHVHIYHHHLKERQRRPQQRWTDPGVTKEKPFNLTDISLKMFGVLLILCTNKGIFLNADILYSASRHCWESQK